MENYFEIQIDENDFYRGQLLDESVFHGLGIFIRKNKFIYMGELH